jgi:L-asparaginase II
MQPMADFYQPIFEVTRGRIVESVHFGALAVVDSGGHLLAWLGDPQGITFLRSSAKPFQALPFIERGGDQAFHLTSRELALICGSHDGTDEHVEVVKGIQAKVGVQESDLLCGAHPLSHLPTVAAMQARGEVPTPNRHNCSGKHTGMLAAARMRGLPIAEYINPEHPVQKSILETLGEMCSLPVEQIEVGMDGCSVPNYALPLYNSALGFARLCDPRGLQVERATSCRRITQSMMANPFMVAGQDRFDTRLMEVCSGRIVAKGGAEGYFWVLWAECWEPNRQALASLSRSRTAICPSGKPMVRLTTASARRLRWKSCARWATSVKRTWKCLQPILARSSR